MATTTISLPANITITNKTSESAGDARVIGFVPYRENFTSYLQPGGAVVLEATTSGQVLYYMAQATDGLTVTQAAKA